MESDRAKWLVGGDVGGVHDAPRIVDGAAGGQGWDDVAAAPATHSGGALGHVLTRGGCEVQQCDDEPDVVDRNPAASGVGVDRHEGAAVTGDNDPRRQAREAMPSLVPVEDDPQHTVGCRVGLEQLTGECGQRAHATDDTPGLPPPSCMNSRPPATLWGPFRHRCFAYRLAYPRMCS